MSPITAWSDRITLHRGDLFEPLAGKRYDLIISNPPYVDAEGMAEPAARMPRRAQDSPSTAAPTGSTSSGAFSTKRAPHLTPQGGLLCEIGRCRPQLEAAFPQLPLLWLDTEDSEGEVFWIAAADL